MVNVHKIPSYILFLFILETMDNHMIMDAVIAVAAELIVATEEVEVSHACTICGKTCPTKRSLK